MGEKKKKENITWIDDGRTIADMSGVGGGWRKPSAYRPPVRFRDAWRTYWDATKMMLLPTAVAAGALGLIYAVLYVLFSLV